jgi:hypothetical protein
MKPEKQRIAIAEACGWTDVKGTKGVHPKARFKGCGYADDWIALPDYLHDLNAMAEAEQSLWLKDWNLRYVFCDHLADMIRGRRVNRNEWGPELMLDATADQRAEAFLRTIGKWEDDKC